MAIVRTTPKETNSGGTVPPDAAQARSADQTRSVVKPANAVARSNARAVAPRPGTRGAVAPSSGASTPREFIEDTRAELRRVVWPSTEDVQAGVIVTVGMLIVFGIYIFGLDWIISHAFQLLGIYHAK